MPSAAALTPPNEIKYIGIIDSKHAQDHLTQSMPAPPGQDEANATDDSATNNLPQFAASEALENRERISFSALMRMATTQLERYQESQNPSDLNDGIGTLEQAHLILLEGDALDRGALVHSRLGAAFLDRLGLTGAPEDLHQAIVFGSLAVANTPDTHADPPDRLSNLYLALEARFDLLHDVADLDQAILTITEAVELTPNERPDKTKHLDRLGRGLHIRFEWLGHLGDLEKAISAVREALTLIPEEDARKSIHLCNLALYFQTRFDRLDNLDDLKEAISAQEKAMMLTSKGDPEMPGLLVNFSNYLKKCFERTDNLEDLEKAISTLKDAMALTPEGHSIKHVLMGNLGSSLATRFGRLSGLDDLDNAISAFKDEAALIPAGHSSRPKCLVNFGNALEARFDRLGDLADLDAAISAKKEAVNLTPEEHPRKPAHLSYFGIALQTRFKRLGDLEDINGAIAAGTDAVTLSPDGHPDKPERLANLGSSLDDRFNRTNDMDDLDKAISVKRDGLSLTPEGHPQKPLHLNSLGVSLVMRSKRLGAFENLDEAISVHTEAIELTPEGHIDRPGYLSNLAAAHLWRFQNFRDISDLHRTISFAKDSATANSGPPRLRFESALFWAQMCGLNRDLQSAVEAFAFMVSLIPQVAWLGRMISRRYEDITTIGDAVGEAVAIAIEAGEFHLALEWLEEGRSIVWGQMLQLRTPLDDLRAMHPSLAHELERMSHALESAATGGTGGGAAGEHDSSLEAQAQAHRRLAEEWERTISVCRSLPGFEEFLRPSKFSKLSAASEHGTVVVLNVHELWGCDALILPYRSDELFHVPLESLAHAKAANLRARMDSVLTAANIRVRGSRQGVPDDVERILRVLWYDVVRPVFEELALSPPTGETSPADLPHIYWCATGPLAFMPLHAAGDYGKSGLEHRAYNYAVSSYVPTLATLCRPPQREQEPAEFRGILAVSEPSTLPGTRREVAAIMDEVESTDTRLTWLDAAGGSKAAVLKGMAEHDWVHLACHAFQHRGDPLKSAFKLHGGELDLSTIMRQDLKRRSGLAFLSACQTAAGHDDLPEEAIHLAAGMLSAGYSTVLATMWSIQDGDAPMVAKGVYSRLVGEGGDGTADARKAGWALHEATAELREKVGEESYARWVPFIHMGV